ncbi:MAG: magnesium transporter [Gemmatimonadetes bacterium]|nr:MAG: magnesium transporter [Gemmatimonadota bacterium]
MSTSTPTPTPTSPEHETEPLRERIARLVSEGAYGELEALLESLHASDVADVVESLDDETRLTVVRMLPAELAADALVEMEEGEEGHEVLAQLTPGEAAELVHELDVDDAVDLIAELEPEERARILAELPIQEAGELSGLLLYDEESAGGLMNTALVSVRESLSAAEAIEEVRRQGREVEDFYTVFVVDELGRLRGTVPLDDLILADPDEPVANLVEPAQASVTPDTDQEEVARLIARYNLVALPVVTEDGVLLGRVTFDDVIDVIEAERTEDLLLFSGVSDDEELRGSALAAVRARLPWLVVNTLTASLAAFVVYNFQDSIAAATLLAVVMPVVAGLGGNAGQQALAVTVRRLATSGGPLEKPTRVVGKELMVALVNGAAIGLVVAGLTAVVALVTHGADPRIGLVVLLAVWTNIAVAGFAGAFIPTFLHRLGQDPAVASTVFLTAMTDMSGFLLLLGLYQLMIL